MTKLFSSSDPIKWIKSEPTPIGGCEFVLAAIIKRGITDVEKLKKYRVRYRSYRSAYDMAPVITEINDGESEDWEAIKTHGYHETQEILDTGLWGELVQQHKEHKEELDRQFVAEHYPEYA